MVFSANGREAYQSFLKKNCYGSLPANLKVMYFVGRPGQDTEIVGDTGFLDADDSYLGLPDKVHKAFEVVNALEQPRPLWQIHST